ncbi:ferredoxin [Streptomyces sp. SID13666]|uniref:ferredoxin n=1 Tax=Streptomyces TaxID=1883 RepID=UPI001106CAFE|nr:MULTISPECIES: ferredoxin [Streptomyces]MCZ4099661.1 ferredoxin [Streptomyces sp. H39-C1]NEA53181.1 ferredoxin [Streptomyces sp. SID13666]NEA69492.1 ferredoxin [Streptomyces sp. SID13588]QNA70920.1 ferredoxin [Streptomyces sp. So13.3]
MLIGIDHNTCIGSGQCVLTAPDLFTQDDDGYSRLVPGGTEVATRRQAAEAALSCPVRAIAVADEPSAN